MDEAIKKIEAEWSEVIGFICLLDISDPFESIADLDLEFYAHETLSYDADHDFARNRLREDGPDSVLEAYRKNGCIHGREGGDMFVWTSGRVFEHYFDKRWLDEHSLRRFAGELVEVALENDPTLPEQNIALMPLANGALRLGGFIFEELRKVMKTGKVEHLPTCKDENGDVHLHPDYDPATSWKVLFIEDNLTWWGSVLKEVKKVNDLGWENYATWSLLAKNDRTWQEMAKDQGMDGEEIGNFLTLQRYDMITYDRSEVSWEWKTKKKINTSHGWWKQIWEDVAKRREWQAAGFTFDCE